MSSSNNVKQSIMFKDGFSKISAANNSSSNTGCIKGVSGVVSANKQTSGSKTNNQGKNK